MREIPASAQAAVRGNVLRTARLFEIQPQPGQILYLTAHAHDLRFEGRPYVTAGTIEASAQVGSAGLDQFDSEVKGALGGVFFIDDVRLNNGYFRKAKVIETVIDWRFPSLGAIETYQYTITKTRHNHQRFTISVEGMLDRLKHQRGDSMSRTCPVNVGTRQCGVARGDITDSNLAVTNVIDEITFEASGVPLARVENDYQWGRLEWGLGLNRGREATVLRYQLAGFTFTLAEAPAYPISVGDRFDVELGCDGLFTTCQNKFSNHHNFQGQRFARGSAGINKTPTS